MTAVETRTSPPSAPPPRRRRGWALALAAAAAVTAAAVGVGTQLTDGDDPAPRLAPATTTTTAGEPGEPRFALDDGRIIGPDGNDFVPVGVNLLGPDAFFNDEGVTAGLAGTVRDRWGLNSVRLNSCLPEGCPYTGVHNERNDDLDALVEEYTGAGLVVMLALHQVEPGRWPSDAELDSIDAWWRDKATRFAGNELVWFNLLNEPGHDQPVPERWLDMHERWIRTIRGTGAENLIVVDGTQWGQEAGGQSEGRVTERTSAILKWGDELAAVDDRVVFSFHVYDQWGDPDQSDRQRERRLERFVRDVQDAGHAVLIGETGGFDDECCEAASLATTAAYRVAGKLGIGLFAWHGQAIDDHHLLQTGDRTSSLGELAAGEVPGNLTWQGRLLWELAHP